MGKLKALKKLTLSAKEAQLISETITNSKGTNKRKHISFEEEEDDDNNDKEDKMEENKTKDHDSKRTESNNTTSTAILQQVKEEENDNIPEIVHADDISIQELKELHESVSILSSKSSKKKKSTEKSKSKKEKEKGILDVSIFDNMNEDDTTQYNSKDDDSRNESLSYQPVILDHSKVKAKSAKKLGHVELTIIDEKVDYFSSFKVDKSAVEFLKTMTSSMPRISYHQLSSLKKPKPARVFKRKTK